MSTLALYETISGISGDMADAAAAGDWDRLVQLERSIACLRSQLCVEDSHAKLTADERDHKVDLIKRILADDRKIRSYTEPWMEQVRRLLGQATPGGDIRGGYTVSGY